MDWNRVDIRKLSIFIGTGLAILGLLTYGLYWFATHGRVVITNIGDDTFEIASIESIANPDAQIKDLSNNAIVPSGLYALRNDDDNRLRVVHVEVRGWLQTSSVTFSEPLSASQYRKTALSYENYLNTPQGNKVSFTDLYGDTSSYTLHQNDDAFGYKYTENPIGDTFFNPATTPDGQLIGLTTTGIKQYSFDTKEFKLVDDLAVNPAENEPQLYPKLQRSSDLRATSIGLYNVTTTDLSIIRDSKVQQVINLGNSAGNEAVYDFNDTYVTYITREVARGGVTNDARDVETEEDGRDFTINIKNISSGETKNIKLDNVKTIDSLAISPDGKYIATTIDTKLWLFDIETQKPLVADLYNAANQFFWRDGLLLSINTESGIIQLDPVKREIQSILRNPENGLSYSYVTPIGDTLYTTAFSSKERSELPDAYEIKIGDEDNQKTALSLYKNLPINTLNYGINYIDDTIYIRVTYFERSDSQNYRDKVAKYREEANEALRSKIPEDILSQLKIVNLPIE